MVAFAKSIKGSNPVTLILRLLQVVFLLLLGWVLMRAILLIVTPESAWTPLPQVSSVDTANSGDTIRSYDFSTDPFHLAKSESVETPVFADPGFEVPETDLNLVLTGRTVGEPGSAVLKTPDNEERSYRVGEEVMSGVTLQSVAVGFVVLNVRGELERLTFLREESTGLGLMREDMEQATSTNRMPTETQSREIKPQAIPVMNSLKTTDLLQSVRLNPKFENGQLIGHVIQARGDVGALKNFGLKAGDMVTAVNGDSLLQGRLDLQELAITLSKAKQVELDIIRDGRPQTVQIGQ